MYKRRVAQLAAVVLMAAALCACGNEEKYMDKADEFLKKEEYGQALEQYNKAIMEDEELQEAYRGAGIACMKQGDYEKAQDMFLRGLKETNGIINDIELDLSYYLGECQMQLGSYKDAEKTYSNIIEYDEDETEAYFYRGCARLKLENSNGAEKDFAKISGAVNLQYLYGIYEAYEDAGSDKGNSYLKQIVKSDSREAGDLYTVGRAYAQLGDYTKAMDCLKQSSKKGEKAAAFCMGQIYQQQGDFEQALSCYKEYKEKHGLTFTEYHIVAECMMRVGDYESAAELNAYMKESAGKAELQTLAFEEIVIYEKQQDYENARAKAQEYVEKYPDDENGQREYEFLMTR